METSMRRSRPTWAKSPPSLTCRAGAPFRRGRRKGRKHVAKRKTEKTPEELTEQEVEETDGEPLPDREVMSLIRGAEPLPLPIVPDEPSGT